MDALSAEERRRRSEVLAVLRGRLAGVSDTADGLAFELAPGPDTPTLAGEFVALESRCCPFIRFELEVEPDAGPVRLRLGGRPGVKQFLREQFLQG
jgi:hypothetical protein